MKESTYEITSEYICSEIIISSSRWIFFGNTIQVFDLFKIPELPVLIAAHQSVHIFWEVKNKFETWDLMVSYYVCYKFSNVIFCFWNTVYADGYSWTPTCASVFLKHSLRKLLFFLEIIVERLIYYYSTFCAVKNRVSLIQE